MGGCSVGTMGRALGQDGSQLRQGHWGWGFIYSINVYCLPSAVLGAGDTEHLTLQLGRQMIN